MKEIYKSKVTLNKIIEREKQAKDGSNWDLDQDKKSGLFESFMKGIARFALMPASSKIIYNIIKFFKPSTVKDKNFKEQEFTIEHNDGSKVDSKQYQDPANKNVPMKDQKWVVYCSGNTQPYETRIGERYFDVMGDDKRNIPGLHHNYVAFNYRSVGKSEIKTPLTYHTLVQDTVAQVERLVDMGVDPNNITIKGHSIGGATSVKAAAYLKEQWIETKVFDGRSFGDVTDIPKGFMGKLAKRYFPKAGWGYRVVEDYESIAAENREHVFVRAEKEGREKQYLTRKDEIIPHGASLEAMTSDHKRFVELKDKANESGLKSLTKEEKTELGKLDMGHRKRQVVPEKMSFLRRLFFPGTRMHDLDLSTLSTRDAGTAHSLFSEIVNKDIKKVVDSNPMPGVSAELVKQINKNIGSFDEAKKSDTQANLANSKLQNFEHGR